MVSNDLALSYYQVQQVLFTFRKNDGQCSKDKTKFTPKEKSISSKTLNEPSYFREKCSANNEKRLMKNDLGLRPYKKINRTIAFQ